MTELVLSDSFIEQENAVSEVRLSEKYTFFEQLQATNKQERKLGFVCNEAGKVILTNYDQFPSLTRKLRLNIDEQQIVIKPKYLYKRLLNYITFCCQSSIEPEHAKIMLLKQDNNFSALIKINSISYQLDKGLALITVTSKPKIAWPLVQKEFDLTPKELELIKALNSNEKLKKIAELRQVSYYTLRAHLSAIFKKLQVTSQTEAIILLNFFRY